MLIHGTCVEFEGAGVLFRGPSGSAKSDLALRLITEKGAVLVADDQVAVEAVNGTLKARPPASLAGLLEVRGVGLVRMDHRAPSDVRAVIDLCESGGRERVPRPRTTRIAGLPLPLFELDARESSAVSRVVLILGIVRGTLSLHDGFGC